MGTRADFYIGRGEQAEWLGSTAWDGYPDGFSEELLAATTAEEFKDRLAEEFDGREDVTLPVMGWPWPWETSHTTDYAYAFDEGKVWASCFGWKWFDPMLPYCDDDEEEDDKSAVFPDMKSIAKPTLGKRSGIMVIGSK